MLLFERVIFLFNFFDLRSTAMQDLKTYLSTAPVLATLWFGLLAGLLIEINRFYPDALVLPFL